MKKGIALIAVLGLMLAAALMATGVAYMISRYNQRSGLNLYSESAVAAARAGEASTKAWFTHEGQQAVNLLNAYFIQCATAAGCKPHKLDLVGKYTIGNNTQGQFFEAYLVDVQVDSTKSTAPLNVKLQINATGQDSSQSVVTAIYTLKGLSFQQAPPHYAYSTLPFWGKEALFVAGSGANMTQDLTIHGGDLYLGSTASLQAPTKVEGNFISAITNTTLNLTQNLTVDSNAYFGSPITINTTQPIVVKGSAYARKIDFNAGGQLVVGSDTVTGKGGNLWLDSALNIGVGNRIRVLSKGGEDKGNLTLAGYLGFKNTVVVPGIYAMGDVYMPAGIQYAGAQPYVQAGRDVFYDGNCGSNCPFILHSLQSGYAGYGFYAKGVATAARSYLGTEIPPYHGYTPMDFITTADRMVKIRDSLLAGSVAGQKTVPYYLSDSIRIKYQKTWEYWRDNYCGTSCQSQKNAYLTAGDWNAIYEKVAETNASLLQDGYMYVVMDSTWMGQLDNMTTAQEGEILAHNFIFYFTKDVSLKKAYGNTADSRVVWWSRTAFGEFGSKNPIYGIIYAQNGGITISSSLRVHGQLLLANPTSNISSNASLEVWYDNAILADISSKTGLLRPTGSPDSPSMGNTAVRSPIVLSLLSPRLDVGQQSEVWGPTNLDLAPSAVKSFDRSLNLVPAMVSVLKKKYADWAAFDAGNPDLVQDVVYPDTLRAHCGTLARGTNAVDFSKPGTYLVPYSIICSGTTLTSNLVVWVKPDTVFASSSSISTSSSSSSTPVVVSSSSTEVEASSSSETSNVGLVFKFMYHGLSSASCFGSTTASIPLDFSLYNGSIYPVNMADFRFSYFIGSSSPTTWSYVVPSKVQNMTSAVTVIYDTLGRALYYNAGYNLRAMVTFESNTLLSQSAASFENLVLKSTFVSNAKGDYSYLYWNRCPDALETNDYIVVERKVNGVWGVIRGKLPAAWTNSGTMTEE